MYATGVVFVFLSSSNSFLRFVFVSRVLRFYGCVVSRFRWLRTVSCLGFACTQRAPTTCTATPNAGGARECVCARAFSLSLARWLLGMLVCGRTKRRRKPQPHRREGKIPAHTNFVHRRRIAELRKNLTLARTLVLFRPTRMIGVVRL